MNSLTLSYLPLRGGDVAPAVEVDFSAGPHVRGIGIEGGCLVDPRPFVALFPGDADQVSVFAEWVTHLTVMLDAGAGVTEVRNWLEDANPPVLIPAAGSTRQGSAGQDDAERVAPPSLWASTQAVRFMLEVEGLRAVAPTDNGSIATRQSCDFLLMDEGGRACACIEIKVGAANTEPSCGLTLHDLLSHERATFDYSAPTLQKQIQCWLDERDWYRPSFRTRSTY